MQTALDSALVVAAAAVVVFSWAPAARDVVASGGAQPTMLTATIVISSVAAIASLFFVLIPLAEATGPISIASAGAAASFAAATLPLAVGGVDCCAEGNPLALVAVLGWSFLTFGAVSRNELSGPLTLPRGWRLRNVIAPGVALVMGVALVYAGLQPPLWRPTALALGVLGFLLALRLVQLLAIATRQSREQKELAQARVLIEVTNALASETELNSTLAEVTVVACKLLDARASALELISEDGRTLEMKAAAGLPPEVIGMQFPVHDSFTGWVVQSGEPRTSVDPARDPSIADASKKLLGHSPMAAAPLRHRGQPLGVLSCISDRQFSTDDVELLQALADQAAIAIENARLFQQVHSLSHTDPMTKLANRRQLERDLTREFAAARRGRQLVAVMFDLNGFKAYNDRYGHLAGDEALCVFANVLAQETRAMNLAARYGGDEFIVLLADSDIIGARIFVERMRAEFARAAATLSRGLLSVSAGIAEYNSEMKSPDELLAAADRDLYDAKSARSR